MSNEWALVDRLIAERDRLAEALTTLEDVILGALSFSADKDMSIEGEARLLADVVRGWLRAGTPNAPRPRLRACVEAWPDCYEGGYHPLCCRFPKSCSCTVYDDNAVTDADLERPAGTPNNEDA